MEDQLERKTLKMSPITGTYPEFNHNEFMGWVSHPIEKPFVIFDLISEDFDSDKMRQRFALLINY